MTLGFKQQFPWGEPTKFREKVLAVVNYMEIVDKVPVRADSDHHMITVKAHHPKLHTFRADPHNRWKAGRRIEMVYRGAGYRILDHFNKGIPELEKCVSTQKIKIDWIPVSGKHIVMSVLVDGKMITDIDSLAANDGFSSKENFMKWFKKPFEGKIIHWTDLRY